MLSFRNASLVAAITAAVGLLFLLTPLGEGVRRASYDIPLILRPSIRPEEAVIIYMDEASREALKQGVDRPWHRSIHTRLLKKLTEFGAKAVVFDVLMDDPWPKKAVNEPPDQAAMVDEDLAAAMRAHGKVLLAGKADVLRGPILVVTPHLPAKPLLSAAAGWGIVEFDVDPDRKIRRVAHGRLLRGYTNLACKTVEVLGRTVSANCFETRWLNFYGEAYTIPHCSYYRVLEPSGVPSQLISGKVVFVGYAPIIGAYGVTGDFRPTPVGTLPGVEIQATAFLNLWRNDWLTELPRTMECVLIVVVACLFGYGCGLSRPRTTVALALGGVVLVSWGSCLLAWHLNVWFPWLIVASVQVPCAAICSLLGRGRGPSRQPEIPFES